MSNEQDFHQQMLRYEGDIYRLLLSLTGDFAVAEALLQQTVRTLGKEWSSRDQNRPPLSWAFGIAKKQAKNHMRGKSQGAETLDLDDSVVEQISIQQSKLAARSHAHREALQACLQELPQEQREMVQVYYESDQPLQEVAERFQVSTDGLHKSLQRSRRLLFACVNGKLAVGETS